MKKIKLLLMCIISMLIFSDRVNAIIVEKGDATDIVSDGVTHQIYEKYTQDDHIMLYCLSGANVAIHEGSGYSEINNLTEIQKLTIGNIINNSSLTYIQKEVAIFTYLGKVGKVTDNSNVSYTAQVTATNAATGYLNAVSTLSETSLNFVLNGDNYESQNITVGATTAITSVSYTVSSTDESIKPTITKSNGDKTFKVMIPKNQIDNLEKLSTIKVDISVTISSPNIKIYTYDSTHQDLAMLTNTSRNLTNSISGEIGVTRLVINKVDEESKSLSDAKIKIECISENCSFKEQTIITTDEEYVLSDIPYGTYKISELEAPNGYVLEEEPKETTISATNLQENIVLTNNLTKVEISKVSIADGKLLKGATLQIEDEKGKIVKYCSNLTNNECKWESGEEVLTITGIPYGTYYLVETKAPEGYALQKEKVKFVVDEKTSIVKVKMENATQVDVPDTLSSRSVLFISIAMFCIALGIGILTYVKKQKA